MRLSSAGRQRLRFLLIFFWGLTAVALFSGPRPERSFPQGRTRANCVLALRGWRSSALELSAGFHYELLQRLGRDVPWDPDVRPERWNTPLDSLCADSVDLVVLPRRDSVALPDRWYATPVFPDGTVWIIRDSREDLVRTVHTWADRFFRSREYTALKDRFAPSYEPFRRLESGQVFSRISPYDDLLKKYAAQLGWDWHLLAALVWIESQFRIEARSSRGAEGLMQLMPVTARRHRADDRLDPEDNLRAATEYLQRLQQLFAGRVDGPEELIPFTLAAYNAGEVRVTEILDYAASNGKTPVRWDDAVRLYAGTEDGEGPGFFLSRETLRFLEDIAACRDAFQRLCP